MRRKAVLTGVAVVLVVAGVFAGVRWLTHDDDAGVGPVRPAVAEAEARRACRAFARFEALVADNAPSNEVYQALDEAHAAAHDAADDDPRWRSLASGTEALDVAFRRDNARAARIGVDVVRGQCETAQ